VARKNNKKKSGVTPEDARGKGDAVWIVPRTEHITPPPRVSFRELLSRQKRADVVQQAVDSFGQRESASARRKAVDGARRVIEESRLTAAR
jgi:hypothetical protein